MQSRVALSSHGAPRVHNGDRVAISISITFQTLASERRTLLYKANYAMRKHGLSPTPVGKSPLRDAAKFNGFRAARRAKKLFHISTGEVLQRY